MPSARAANATGMSALVSWAWRTAGCKRRRTRANRACWRKKRRPGTAAAVRGTRTTVLPSRVSRSGRPGAASATTVTSEPAPVRVRASFSTRVSWVYALRTSITIRSATRRDLVPDLGHGRLPSLEAVALGSRRHGCRIVVGNARKSARKVAVGNPRAVDALDDDVSQPADVRGNHPAPSGMRLNRHEPERLGDGW